jgi:hypothetical protein
MSRPQRRKRNSSRSRVRKKIFIASSSEAKGKAELIAQKLKEHGFAPQPWWDKSVFAPGDITFDRLLQLPKAMDGAIFLASGDEKQWYRGSKRLAPRDNVVLELGLFAMHLGISRSIVLREPGARIPSDLAGVTYVSTEGGIEAAAERAAEHFQGIFDEDPAQASTPVHWDPELVSVITGELPRSWLMRAFYFGPLGARAWLSITTDPGYQTQGNHNPTHDRITTLLNKSRAPFRTFVSLGPGDGRLDQKIAYSLRKRDSELSYVPVDLSDGLLLNASKQLADQHIRVPMGILADFEERISFVADQVRRHAKPPYLYGLFGNTFGNLDGGEGMFIDALIHSLKKDDEVMIDVTVRKPPDAPLDIAQFPRGAVEFYAHGAAMRLGIDPNMLKVESREGAVRMVRLNTDRVGLDEFVDDNEIPGTKMFEFYTKDENGTRQHLCARIRRYDLKSLIRWFKERDIEVRDHFRVAERGAYDTAIIALRKPA